MSERADVWTAAGGRVDAVTSEIDPWLVARTVTIHVDAPVDVVFALVSDVERIGEWSPECRSARWLGGERGVGARFRGSNRSGLNRWSRTCEVLVDDPGREFSWRTVPGPLVMDDSTLWGFLLEPTATGTELTQRMQMIKKPRAWFRPYIQLAMPQHLDMRDQMRTTLGAIRDTARATSAGSD